MKSNHTLINHYLFQSLSQASNVSEVKSPLVAKQPQVSATEECSPAPTFVTPSVHTPHPWFLVCVIEDQDGETA